MSKPFQKYDPYKHRAGSTEHSFYWQGVAAGGDMAKDEVQYLIDQYREANKPVPYELDRVLSALKDAFEDK